MSITVTIGAKMLHAPVWLTASVMAWMLCLNCLTANLDLCMGHLVNIKHESRKDKHCRHRGTQGFTMAETWGLVPEAARWGPGEQSPHKSWSKMRNWCTVLTFFYTKDLTSTGAEFGLFLCKHTIYKIPKIFLNCINVVQSMLVTAFVSYHTTLAYSGLRCMIR